MVGACDIIHVGIDRSCDMASSAGVDEMPTDRSSAGRVGNSRATDDGGLATSRTRDRVIAEHGHAIWTEQNAKRREG